MEPQKMDKADFITALFLSFLGLAVLIISLGMPNFRNLGANPYSAPGIVPAFLGVVLFILGMVLLIRSISRKGYYIKFSFPGIILLFKQSSVKRLIIALILSLMYVFLLGKINYFILSFSYIFIFILAYEFNFQEGILTQKTTFIWAFVEAFFISGSIALVFQYLFLVRLP